MMNIFLEKKSVLLPPICKKGTDAIVLGDSTDNENIPSNANKLWYPSESTIILGVRKQNNIDEEFQGCTATWHFDVSKLPNSRFRNLISADLHINTFRTHAGININYESNVVPDATESEITKSKDFELNFICFYRKDKDNKYKRVKKITKIKSGNLYINDKHVDNIDIVGKMPTGRYYGFNKVGPYPIISFVKDSQKNNKEVIITISVDPYVYWDIEEIRLDSLVVETYDLRQIWWIVLGAFISLYLGDILHMVLKNLSIIFQYLSLFFR